VHLRYREVQAFHRLGSSESLICCTSYQSGSLSYRHQCRYTVRRAKTCHRSSSNHSSAFIFSQWWLDDELCFIGHVTSPWHGVCQSVGEILRVSCNVFNNILVPLWSRIQALFGGIRKFCGSLPSDQTERTTPYSASMPLNSKYCFNSGSSITRPTISFSTDITNSHPSSGLEVFRGGYTIMSPSFPVSKK